MLFNSYVFLLVFLPAVLGGYAVLSKWFSRRAALAFLTLASLAYYGWWKPVYLLLIGASIAVNFTLGVAIGRRSGTPAGRTLMVAGVAANLACLGWFKYANFLLDSVNAVADTGMTLSRILLPIGISFFTFQQIAYLVDAFRAETKEVDLVDYTLFVTFFPQLIAGPIVHHREMLPQFTRRGDALLRGRDLAAGFTILAAGLFKKVVLADTAALYATPLFRAADGGWIPSFGDAWLAALAYSMQLYFDFSGYSDMAVGLGRLFGIRLPLNFHSPYKAVSVVDFWRRWHVTLSRFLRDYLYIPLGGNRRGPVRRYGNLLTTMVLGGLWHGAGWTFAAWGLLHGLYLCANHAWEALAARLGFPGKEAGPARRAAARGATFLAVVVGWVLFRAGTFAGAGRILSSMAGGAGLGGTEVLDGGKGLRWVAVMLLVVWALPNTQQWMRRIRPTLEYAGGSRHWARGDLPRWGIAWTPSPAWAALVGLAGCWAVLQMSRASEFIYYQF